MKRNTKEYLLMLGSLLACFSILSGYIAPMLRKEWGEEFQVECIDEITISSDDPPGSWWIYPELQPRQIYVSPVFNWVRYWSTFKDHALWSLEGSLDGETWYEEIPGTGINLTTDVLNLRAEPTGDNSRKITLNFTAIDPPGSSTSAYYRFSFAIDYRVKQFVNRSGDYEYILDFEVENETFSVAFNWSDYINSPLANNSHVRKGITEIGGHDYFYFRVISDNPVEVGTYVELDPSYTVFTGTEVFLDAHSGRKLVRQSNGTLWCTFTENNDIHVAWSEDEGVTWTDYEVYGAVASYNPSLAVDSNDVVHLVFDGLKSDPDDYQLDYTNSSDWTTIVQIRDEDKNHKYPSVAIDGNDNIHVVYQKGEEGTSIDDQVAYINSTDTGGTWGTEKILTNEVTANDDTWYPSIAIDSNNVLHVVFYCEDHPTYDDILHVQSSDYGNSWSNWEADPVYDDASHNERRPIIAIDDNNKLHVVWEGISQYTNDQIGYSHNDSTGWSTVEWLTWDSLLDHTRPSISVNDNDYIHTIIRVGLVRVNHSVNDTSSWTTDEALTGDYRAPNLIFAQHPIIDGVKTNRPKTGYAFICAYSSTNVTFHASADLTWDTGAVENNIPTLTGEIPANTSTGISLTPICNITANDEDGGDTLDVCFYENTSGSYVLQQKNASVSPGTNVQWDSYIEAKTELTDYYWMVTVDDATDNISEIYYFTTAVNRTWQNISTGYLTGGNLTVNFNNVSFGYLTGGNITDFTNISSGYLTGGNLTVEWNNISTGYLTGGNVTLEWNNISSGYLTGGNIIDFTNVSTGYLTGGNATINWENISSGYLTGGNLTVNWDNISTGYITGGNTTVLWRNTSSGYLTGGNITSPTNVSTGYLTGGNITVTWNNISAGWLTGGNTTLTVWRNISSGYLTGGNTSSIPLFSNEDPTNGSIIYVTSYRWNITINDTRIFNWTIECSNGQNSSGTNDTNGTFSLNLTALITYTTYTVWTNASNNITNANASYIFTVMPIPISPLPSEDGDDDDEDEEVIVEPDVSELRLIGIILIVIFLVFLFIVYTKKEKKKK